MSVSVLLWHQIVLLTWPHSRFIFVMSKMFFTSFNDKKILGTLNIAFLILGVEYITFII